MKNKLGDKNVEKIMTEKQEHSYNLYVISNTVKTYYSYILSYNFYLYGRQVISMVICSLPNFVNKVISLVIPYDLWKRSILSSNHYSSPLY